MSLNVYDLGDNTCGMVNTCLHPLGLGFFHCGVEVYGWEWSYFDSAPLDAVDVRSTGIFYVQPRSCEGHHFSMSVPMGDTKLSENVVMHVLHRMEPRWPIWQYDMLKRNCQHFCCDFCTELGVGPIPGWVSRVVDTAVAVDGATTMVACCRSPSEVGQALPPEEIVQDERRQRAHSCLPVPSRECLPFQLRPSHLTMFFWLPHCA